MFGYLIKMTTYISTYPHTLTSSLAIKNNNIKSLDPFYCIDKICMYICMCKTEKTRIIHT